MPAAQHNRKEYLDILRGVATVGVLFIHVSSDNWYGYIGSFDWLVFTVYRSLFRWAVPVFFMISGALFLSKKQSYRHVFKKIIRLAVFLLFWAVIYKIINPPAGGSMSEIIRNAVSEILHGITQTHLWFIYVIIGIYLITPILSVFSVNASDKELGSAVVFCFALGWFFELFIQVNADTPLAVSEIYSKITGGFPAGFIGYYLLGTYLDRCAVKSDKRKIIYILGIISMVLSVILVINDCISNQAPLIRTLTYTMPYIIMESIAVFVLIKYNSEKISYKVKTIINHISGSSLGIYGMHYCFIYLFWGLGFSTFSFFSVLSVPVLVVIILICSLAVSKLLAAVPGIGKYLV